MSLRDVSVDVLLAAGVALELFACAGAVLMRGALDRLHFLGPTTLAAACICAAVFVRESFSIIGDKALLLAAVLLACGPVLTHVTARAIHMRGESGGAAE